MKFLERVQSVETDISLTKNNALEEKMAKKYEGKNANYNFADQKEPKKRFGQGDFANLPTEPMTLKYDGPEYRDGLINSFSCTVSELSGIYENQRGQ